MDEWVSVILVPIHDVSREMKGFVMQARAKLAVSHATTKQNGTHPHSN